MKTDLKRRSRKQERKAAPGPGSRERAEEMVMVGGNREQVRKTTPKPGSRAMADMEAAGTAAWAVADIEESGTEGFAEKENMRIM